MINIIYKFLWKTPVKQTRLTLKLAIISIAITTTLVITAESIIQGFKRDVIYLLTSFTGQISVEPYDNNLIDYSLVNSLKKHFKLKAVYPTTRATAIIKNNETMEGIVLVGTDNNWKNSNITKYIIEGKIPDLNKKQNTIIISKTIADKLNIKLNDSVILYFLQKNLKVRKMKVSAIYYTGLEDYDKQIIFAPIKTVQKVLKIPYSKVQNIAIQLHKDQDEKLIAEKLNKFLPYNLVAYSSKEKFPEIYDWLTLQQQNVNFIFLLVLIVVVMNLTATILIITVEKLPYFALLNVLGLTTKKILMVLTYIYIILMSIGLFAGNLLSYLLLFFQDKFKIITLDPKVYFLDSVPVGWNFLRFLSLDFNLFIFSIIAIILPFLLLKNMSLVSILRWKR